MPQPPSPPQPPLRPQPCPGLIFQPQFLLKAVKLSLVVRAAVSLVVFFIAGPKHNLLPRSVSLAYPPQPTNRRRLVRLTSATAAMSQNQNPNPNFSSFPTPQSLSDWLKPRLPSESFAAWGTKPGTKNVHNLWLELADGETSLVDTTPPIRNLQVVCVRILGKDGSKVLLESQQELSDGTRRKRDRPLSEKLKSDEEIESAVKRAIQEELGSIIFERNDGRDVNLDEIVRIVPNSYVKKVEERVSVSYPGLPACYVLHIVDAFVEGLPDDEFVTEEGTEYGDCDQGVVNEAVAVKKHFWKWVPADSV